MAFTVEVMKRVGEQRISTPIEVRLLDCTELEMAYGFISRFTTGDYRSPHFRVEPMSEMFKPYDEGGAIFGMFDEVELVGTRYIYLLKADSNYLGDLFKLPNTEGKSLVYLKSTVIHPAFRGNGLQAKSCQWAMDYAKAQGYCRFLCTIYPLNTYSLRNMLSMGLSIRKLVKLYPTAEESEGLWRFILYGDEEDEKALSGVEWVKQDHYEYMQALLTKGYVGDDYREGKIRFSYRFGK